MFIQKALPVLLQWHSEGNISHLWLHIRFIWRPGGNKKSGPCWQANSIDISEWDAEHVFFFWRGECKCFKVPQVILFSFTTLSSVWDTSSQIREQTLAPPPPQTAVEAWRPTHWTTREVPPGDSHRQHTYSPIIILYHFSFLGVKFTESIVTYWNSTSMFIPKVVFAKG